MSGIKQTGDLFRATERQLAFYAECIEDICRGDDEDAMRKAKGLFAEACDALNSLMDTWKQHRTRAEEAFKKVVEVTGK
jgi:hypothetical protein